jgi:inner membrane protein
MPSLFSHPAVPLALAAALPREIISPGLIFLGMVCATIPDLDVVGFRFGISYGHVLGHRGLSHSMLFAALLAGSLALLFPLEVQRVEGSRLTVFAFLFLSALSHGVLDAMTSGGLGVAFFAPFDNTRYFFPWRPIRVSPISVSAFFSATGRHVLQSEVQWVWLPAASLAAVILLVRRIA